MSTNLTSNQERFVKELIEGKTQRQAYLSAYPTSAKWKPEQVDSKASVLFSNVKVRERYKTLQDKATAPSILTCVQLKEFLSGVIMATGEKTSDKLKAVELLGKTQALFIDKVDMNGSMQFNSGGLKETLEALREK